MTATDVVNADTTLYAKWVVKKHMVTFNANGGGGGWTKEMEYGATITPPTVTRDGYTFKGWSPAADATVPDKDVTYTAQWTKNGGGDTPGGGEVEPPAPCYEMLEADDITTPYAAPKAVTLRGAVYDGCDVVGIVELKLGTWHVQSADVGGNWAKAASVKWAKPKKGAATPEIYDASSGKGLIVDTSKGGNLSGLKLTYTPKKGAFKGSFKVYALEGSGKAMKLKKHTVKVSGIVVDGVGYGIATCKKPAVSWAVTVW